MYEITRRDFLKISAVAGVALIAGEGLKGGSSLAYGGQIPEIEKATITIITDNYYDALRPDANIAKRYRMKPGTSIYNMNLHAEHGLACCVETVVDGKSHFVMFDFGVDSQGVIKNMELLGIDMKMFEALVLTHGHFDHWGALIALLKVQRGKVTKGIPLDVGEEAFSERFVQFPTGLQTLELRALYCLPPSSKIAYFIRQTPPIFTSPGVPRGGSTYKDGQAQQSEEVGGDKISPQLPLPGLQYYTDDR